MGGGVISSGAEDDFGVLGSNGLFINHIFFHHVPDSEDYVIEPHLAVHDLASSTKIECSQAPARNPCFL